MLEDHVKFRGNTGLNSTGSRKPKLPLFAGQGLISRAFVFSLLVGLFMCGVEKLVFSEGGGQRISNLALVMVGVSFVILSLVGVGIGLVLGIYHGREQRFRGICLLAGLYCAIISLLCVPRVFNPAAGSETLLLLLGAGWVLALWGWFAWRPPEKFLERVLGLSLFFTGFAAWCWFYPEKAAFAPIRPFPGFFHLGYLALMLAAAFAVRNNLIPQTRMDWLAVLVLAWAIIVHQITLPPPKLSSDCMVPSAPAVRGEDRTSADGPLPNIVLIVLDTARRDRLSLYGYERPTTPFLETLAQDSLVFTQMKSVSPWTLPSHASLFTGLYPREHGARNFMTQHEDRYYFSRLPLRPSFQTLAEVLRDQYGYQTGAVSANFSIVTRAKGLAQGFNWFCNDPNPRFVGREKFQIKVLNDSPAFEWLSHLGGRLTGVSAREFLFAHFKAAMPAEQVSRLALDWVRGADPPFFLFLNYMDAHLPYYPPQKFWEKFQPATGSGMIPHPLTALPPCRERAVLSGGRGLEPTEQADLNARYDAEIAYLDHSLRTLIQGLKQQGRYDPTLIIITSDHGELLGEHHLFRHGWVLYEELLAVPLLMKLPHSAETGVVPAPVQTTDLFDAVLSIIQQGVFQPQPHPLVAEWYERSAAPEEYPFDQPQYRRTSRAAYFGQYKIILHSNGTGELYHLQKDPREKFNLAPYLPKIYQQGQQLIADFLDQTNDPLLDQKPQNLALTREEKRKLQALGYAP